MIFYAKQLSREVFENIISNSYKIRMRLTKKLKWFCSLWILGVGFYVVHASKNVTKDKNKFSRVTLLNFEKADDHRGHKDTNENCINGAIFIKNRVYFIALSTI
ncbi:hypothetical protein CDIK_2186 [Cucumispora dikerogammari]|nr:hypothetical protein CDIK_2186 [Cucumispora dikerogammari]